MPNRNFLKKGEQLLAHVTIETADYNLTFVYSKEQLIVLKVRTSESDQLHLIVLPNVELRTTF